MVQFLFFKILLYLPLFQIIVGDFPNYACDLEIFRRRFHNFPNFICTLNQVNLTFSNKHFKLIVHEPVDIIQGIDFVSSSVKVLTDDICKALPFVEIFNASHLNLDIIEPNAFKRCNILKEVLLTHNSLTSLPMGIFAMNEQLTKVHLNYNNLTIIDEKLFGNNVKLTHLDISKNFLSTLPLNLLSNCTKLSVLSIKSNQFSDLPILHDIMNLREVSLQGNNFDCDHRQLISHHLTKKSITSDNFTKCNDTEHIWETRATLRTVKDEHHLFKMCLIVLGGIFGLILVILTTVQVMTCIKINKKPRQEPPGPQMLSLKVQVDKSRNCEKKVQFERKSNDAVVDENDEHTYECIEEEPFYGNLPLN